MTNAEWIKSLNRQQRKRRRNAGLIPEFAIYRVYNHSAKKWQFPDIISSNADIVRTKLYGCIGFGSFKYRFDIQPWLIYNPILLNWEEVHYAFERGGKEPLAGTVFLHKKIVEVRCEKWLQKEHVEEIIVLQRKRFYLLDKE